MAIQSIDNLISSLSAGKEWFHIWNKIVGAAGYTAGRWYDMSGLNGTPIANAWSGSALAFQEADSASSWSLYHGGDVSPDTKHILHQMAVTAAATGVPAFILIQDMEGYWPGINMNANTSQTLTGTPSLRYTNGIGLRAYLTVQATTGATPHNLSMSYTDQDGNTGNSLPVTVACTASAIVPHITHSGTAANNYGPYLPLAAGNYGIRNVASVQLSASSGSASTASLVLARPLGYLPLTTASVASIVDYLNMLPSLPVVKDGACLTFLLFAGAAVAANTNFYGATGFVWG